MSIVKLSTRCDWFGCASSSCKVQFEARCVFTFDILKFELIRVNCKHRQHFCVNEVYLLNLEVLIKYVSIATSRPSDPKKQKVKTVLDI